MSNKELFEKFIQQDGVYRENNYNGVKEILENYLDGAFRKEFYIKGEVIAEEGKVDEYMYIIERGKVMLSRRDLRGKEYSSGYLMPGEFFDISSYSNLPHPSTYKALSNCSIYRVEISKVKEILETVENVKKTMMNYMINVWSIFNRRYGSLAMGGCKESFVNFLLEHLHDFGRVDESDCVVITLDVNLTDIAAILNMTRETLSRIVSEMKKEGIIDNRRRFVKILNMQRFIEG